MILKKSETLVKSGDLVEREGTRYKVVIADSDIFVICESSYRKEYGVWVTDYGNPKIYVNQSQLNTLDQLGFKRIQEPTGR